MPPTLSPLCLVRMALAARIAALTAMPLDAAVTCIMAVPEAAQTARPPPPRPTLCPRLRPNAVPSNPRRARSYIPTLTLSLPQPYTPQSEV